MAVTTLQEDSTISKPIKRMRWATQRVGPGASAHRKRHGIMSRFHKNAAANEKRDDTEDGQDGSQVADDNPAASIQKSDENGQVQRRVFFNIPLPADAKDAEGRPLTTFVRNKIRTAKYTPLSFVVKNLWFQFHNIANVYFLFLIILSIWSIFGVVNPALGAVPLLVILVITAIKDAIEDWRRTVLDNELNNSPVHRLVGWNNVNTSADDISLWRRFKKATTRGIIRIWQVMADLRRKDQKQNPSAALSESRPSIDTRASYRASITSSRQSFHSAELDAGAIQMTPVPSPVPRNRASSAADAWPSQFPSSSLSYEPARESHQVRRSGGAIPNQESLINPTKHCPGTAKFAKDYWKNVQVGDFVRVYNDDQIPADIAILSTSDSDGACYVETKNLDGETNLKVRQALKSGEQIKHARNCEQAEFTIESEPPHANLYQYSGLVRWNHRTLHDPHGAGVLKAEPISINNLLLRGCSLRNTEWALGVVVFTGAETKIMLNSGITPSKRSRITRELNWNVIYNFCILLVMCMISGTVQGATWAKSDASLNFFDFGSIGGWPSLDGFITFWSALILFQNLVPISLYISLEIIRTAQAFFIYSDTAMYYDRLDYPCTPKSWNISDDLGQIEYIFSDKTGTLTQNVMEFKKCSINGVPYGEAYTEAQAGMQKRQGIDVEEEATKARKQIAEDRMKMLQGIRKLHANPYLRDDDLTFVAPDFIDDLGGSSGTDQKEANTDFMLALALCHTVITEKTPGDPPRIEFKAQSPDEAALVATARDCGFTVLGRSNENIVLNVLGEEREYQILNTLEFNSTRKRMSAIVRMPDSRIILFCKGADSIIYSRLLKGEQAQLRKSTADHLEMFAREGLRTLCIARRELSEAEYQDWNKEHDLAAAAVMDREDKLEAVADAIERELTLLGGTAIEDRLQDGVPDTIALLGNAGIKLWVLTGDKVETAINIGFSCNLLDNDMDLILLKVDASEQDAGVAETTRLLDEHLRKFGKTGSDEELVAARKDHGAPKPGNAIVVDGESLKFAIDPINRQKFLLLCKECKSVLCCRVSPAQKASVVSMVKSGLDVMTLSVGDGANDVAMIQEADVGVGIAGEEGRQAVMSSDYAIGQFRYLQRLILVHGRWSYRRLGETIANFFYKNIVWTFALFWYQIYNNFDCTYLFDYTYVLLVNLAFTSLPIIFMGILDQDVSDKVSLAVPELYRRGIERKEWTQTKFWLYMVDGLYQSVICFFMAYLLFSPARPVTHNGLEVNDRPRQGVYVATAAIVVVNLYVLLNTYRWDWLMLLLTIISCLLIWFWTGIYTAFSSSQQFYKAAPEVYGSLSFWVLTLLIVFIALLPRFTIKSFQKVFYPYDIDIIREQVREGKFRYLDDIDPENVATMKTSPASSSELSGKSSHSGVSKSKSKRVTEEDRKPIYPPSVARTTTTRNNRSNNGSDGTEYTGHRASAEQASRPVTRDGPLRSPHVSLSSPTAMDRPRPSFDRMRQSMDRTRPSFEASDSFTSAALLTRIESSHSETPRPRLTVGKSSLR